MTIRNRLRIGFGLLILLMLITGLVVGWYVRSADQAIGEVVNVEEPASAAAYEMEATLKEPQDSAGELLGRIETRFGRARPLLEKLSYNDVGTKERG